MGAEQRAGVLAARVALDLRLEQVAERRGQADRQAEQQCLPLLLPLFKQRRQRLRYLQSMSIQWTLNLTTHFHLAMLRSLSMISFRSMLPSIMGRKSI